ncbi:MAG: hypothetical protein V5A74_07100 [Desulfohalobiaceae bacterium]
MSYTTSPNREESMRLSDLILVLGPVILIAFALGVVDAAFIRVIVITAVVAAAGYWFATRLAGKHKKARGSGDANQDEEGPDKG